MYFSRAIYFLVQTIDYKTSAAVNAAPFWKIHLFFPPHWYWKREMKNCWITNPFRITACAQSQEEEREDDNRVRIKRNDKYSRIHRLSGWNALNPEVMSLIHSTRADFYSTSPGLWAQRLRNKWLRLEVLFAKSNDRYALQTWLYDQRVTGSSTATLLLLLLFQTQWWQKSSTTRL